MRWGTEMIRTSESTKLLTAALIEFHRSEVSVPKSATNPFFKSKYADLWTIKAACDPVLSGLGLVVTQFPGTSEMSGSTLITRLAHLSGEFMEAETPLLLTKDDPQAQGSAITYMRRYAYSAILGIVADPDDDGNAASVPRAKRVIESTTPAVSTPSNVDNAGYETVNGDQIPKLMTEDIHREGPPSTIASPKQANYLKALLMGAGKDAEEWPAIVNRLAPPWPDSLNNLSKSQVSTLIDAFKP